MGQLGHPYALALFLIPVIIGIVALVRRRKAPDTRALLMSLPKGVLHKEKRRTRRMMRGLFLIGLLGLLGVTYVIARPYGLKSQVQRNAESVDIVLVLDVSESMEADDFAPSRFPVAKAVVRDFISRRTEDRIAIVTFSGDAVTKSPLTRDYDFLQEQIEDIRLRELKQGTAIGMGLANGIARLRGSQAKNKVVILLTDGDSNVGAINPITAAHLAKQENIRIYTIGIGKSNRVVVPIYSYDMFGRRSQLVAQVPSYLNPELLKDIARIAGGKAYMARDPGMLSQMLQEIDRLEKTKIKITKLEEREEHFWFPALIATILLFFFYLLKETRFQRVRFATESI